MSKGTFFSINILSTGGIIIEQYALLESFIHRRQRVLVTLDLPADPAATTVEAIEVGPTGQNFAGITFGDYLILDKPRACPTSKTTKASKSSKAPKGAHKLSQNHVV